MNANKEHFVFSYNDVWNNYAEYKDIEDLTGINGNMSTDPLFQINVRFQSSVALTSA
jgi:hypothetical protein